MDLYPAKELVIHSGLWQVPRHGDTMDARPKVTLMYIRGFPSIRDGL